MDEMEFTEAGACHTSRPGPSHADPESLLSSWSWRNCHLLNLALILTLILPLLRVPPACWLLTACLMRAASNLHDLSSE